jgi:ABC-type lipoprotein release transport system permease subunit
LTAVAVLIVVLSVTNGLSTALQQRFSAWSRRDHQRLRRAAGRLASDARVLGQPDPRGGSFVVVGQALAVAGERLGGVTVRGVEPELERESRRAITREGDIGACRRQLGDRDRESRRCARRRRWRQVVSRRRRS